MKGEGCFVLTTIDLNVRVEINIHTSDPGNTCVYILYFCILYYKMYFIFLNFHLKNV